MLKFNFLLNQIYWKVWAFKMDILALKMDYYTVLKSEQ